LTITGRRRTEIGKKPIIPFHSFACLVIDQQLGSAISAGGARRKPQDAAELQTSAISMERSNVSFTLVLMFEPPHFHSVN
jgi:hypothetical protein